MSFDYNTARQELLREIFNDFSANNDVEKGIDSAILHNKNEFALILKEGVITRQDEAFQEFAEEVTAVHEAVKEVTIGSPTSVVIRLKR